MSDKPVVLIVAGGTGIGADSAHKLAESGYSVAVMSSSGKGKELGKELGGIGYTGSILSDSDLAQFVEMAADRFGRIDGLVVCSGHGPKGDILEITDEKWHLGLDYYLLHVIRICRHAVPIMLNGGKGSIVNISTFATFEPDADFPTSSVFRAGLASYAKLFSTKYASQNLRMNNVLPGFIDTLPEKPSRVEQIPMGRYGKVRELSEMVAFLISDASSYITGQNIRVDGGLTASV